MCPAKQYKIVVLAENHARRDRIKSSLADVGHTSFYFEKINICLDNLVSLHPDLVILGSPAEQQAYRFLNAVTLIGIAVPVLILSDLAPIKQFIDLNGYRDDVMIQSEFSASDIDRFLGRIQRQSPDKARHRSRPTIVGNSAEMVRIKKLIPDLSRSREKVLIIGEPGTGREFLAKTIHSYAGGLNEAFIKIQPSGLQHTVDQYGRPFGLDAHRTNADRTNDDDDIFGLHTIFIDELDQVPAQQQTHLFYLLQLSDRQSNPSQKNHPGHIRIIASAKSDLQKMVEAGAFSKGLYYRLNVIHIDMPPLRHRSQDIPLLVDFFADRTCLKLNKSFVDISADTKIALSRHTWNGNARELQKVVKRIITEGNEKDILAYLDRKPDARSLTHFSEPVEDIYTLAELKDIKKYLTNLSYVSLKEICREFNNRIEKKMMTRALTRANGNRKKAALLLDISYKSLLNKMKTYNLQ